MHFKKVWLILLIIPLLWACTYHPQDEYINPAIYPPAPINASIDISNIIEPYYLINRTDFYFQIDRQGKNIISFEIIRDGINWLTGTNEKFNLIMDPNDYADGIHIFNISYKLSSGSGSVAEMLGAEYYLVEKEFTIIVNRTPPPPITGLRSQLIDGKLLISWNKPSGNNFALRITTQNEFTENSYNTENFFISDLTITNLAINSFTGGKIKFTISQESIFFSVSNVSDFFELVPIEANVSLDEDNRVKINWNTLVNLSENTFIKISGSKSVQIFPFKSGETIVDSLILGENVKVSIRVISSNEFESFGFLNYLNIELGVKIQKFDYFSFLPTQNKLITSKGHLMSFDEDITKIYRYNATTLAIEDSLIIQKSESYQMFISQNGEFGYIKFDSYNQTNPVLYPFNPLNFSETKSNISITSISYSYFGTFNYAYNYSLSNTNHLLFLNGNGVLMQVHDLNSKTVSWYRDNVNDGLISHDGSYIVISKNNVGIVYHKTSSVWEEIGKVPVGKYYFTSDTNPELIITKPNLVEIYSLTTPPSLNGDLTLLRSSSLNTTSFDHTTNQLIRETVGVDKISSMYIYDIQDFRLSSEVKANLTSPYGSYNHYYANNYHLVTSGYIDSSK
jgi:hypothetical protein